MARITDRCFLRSHHLNVFFYNTLSMQAVVLAAGRSSRFWPLSDRRHKALLKIRGKSLLRHTLESLEDSGVDEAVVVQGSDRDIEEELEKEDLDLEIRFVVQEEPRGTGNAIQKSGELLEDRFLVMNPYRANIDQLLDKKLDKYRETGADAVLLSKETDKPWKYGILETEGDRAENIVEKPDKGQEPSNHRVVGSYLLGEEILDYLDRTETHEYQFEDALNLYMEEKDVRVVYTDKKASSIKYPWDLFGVVEELFEPIERDVAESADIADSAEIKGRVVVGEEAKIYENAVLKGPCYIGDNVVVGNNTVVRNHSNLEDEVIVGANSEVRGSIVQEDTHIHQTYLGDSILGRNVRVGAGTVFSNRGKRKEGERPEITVKPGLKEEEVDTGLDRLGAMVGDNTDIATQANIMPGIQIGADCFIGPPTTVLKNVESGKTVYTKFDNRKK
ncbi:MAG: bifunctional sugar-1-phosphate nucleotidylyltransferase/acetyltransferase [Candidatus Nanohaloarchaea archaeon]|nr:bifunctional sugar-1-phosphate nucleotidylyltransferase/acetyltransferase [Candidatus Nanohaloarchaea archaeon]